MDLSQEEKPALQRSTESAFGQREEESQTVMRQEQAWGFTEPQRVQEAARGGQRGW